MNVAIDDIDVMILRQLMRDARTKRKGLATAKTLGVSKNF